MDATPPPAARPDQKPLQVLIAEDSEIDAELMVRELGRYGFAVDWQRVENAAALQAALSERPWDVVLSDYSMPGFDARGAMSIVEASGLDLPIIIISGTIGEETAVEAMRAGAYDYLLKDRLTRLGPAVERALSEAAGQRARRQAEEALRESEERFRKLFELSPDAIVLIEPHDPDVSWPIIDCNETACHMNGYARSELIGQSIDILHKEAGDLAERDAYLGRLRREGVFNGEVVHRRKDGTLFPVMFSTSLITLGNREFVLGIDRDITERKQAEEAILREREKAQMYLDTAGVMLLALGRDQTVTMINPKGCKVLGYEMDQVIGEHWLDRFVPEHDRARTKAVFEQIVQGKLEPAEYFENAVVTSSGEERTIAWHNTTLKGRAGEIIGTFSSGEDVTERRRAEEALERERYLMNALMDNAPDAIYFKDAQSRFIRVNRALARKHGLENPEQAIGTTDFDYFAKESAQAYSDIEKAVMRTGQPVVNVEEEEVWPDRPPTWASTTTMPLRDRAGDIVGVFGTTRDITERKQAEKALQRYADRLATLRKVDLAILSARSPEEIAESALQSLEKLVPCQQSSITVFDFEAGEFARLAVETKGKTEIKASSHLPLEHFDIDWEKLRQNQIGVTDDIDALAQPSPIFVALKAEGMRSLINVPLMVQADLIGSLNLAATSPGFFTAEHREIAQEVAGQLAVAIQQARLYEAERDQRVLAEALRATAAAVTSTLELDGVLSYILSNLGQVVPHDAAEMWLIEGGVARVAGCRGYAERGSEEALLALRLPVGKTANLSEALKTGKPVRIPDVAVYPGWVASETTGWAHSVVTVPMQVADRALGFINLVSASPGFYTASHAERLQAFADQAAIAIRNAELYQELENYNSILEQAVEERTAELRVQKEQAEAILQSTADAIAITDPEGFFVAVNPAFTQQMGYTVDEAVGQHIRLLSKESPDNPLIKEVISAARSAHSWRTETQITRKDGSHFDAEVSIASLNRGQGSQLRGFVVALHDISAFKEVERMKDEFLSTAAHELRTPLTSIRGFSEILLTRDLPEGRQKSYLGTISSQSTQLAQIIDDLLDISRLEAGRGLDLKPEPVDMAALIAEAVQPFIDTSPSHHFALDGLADSPPVQGDPFRLGQVVRNLLSNAVKYSPEGGPVVLSAEAEAGYLAISVQDRGIGMTPEQQVHLFERFYRADTASRSIGGTGLGLTICKLIVEGHGGQMRVKSEYGKGSTFTFTVPLADVRS